MPHIVEVSRDQIIEWLATREVRSMRTRNIRRITKPWSCREVVFTCSNGWTIEVLPPEDQPIEGFFMGHCMGTRWSGAYDNAYSLREPDGTPHTTIVGQACTGRADKQPKDEYMALIREWNPHARPSGFNGPDNEVAYHQKGMLDDTDWRDGTNGTYWHDARWKEKRANLRASK